MDKQQWRDELMANIAHHRDGLETAERMLAALDGSTAKPKAAARRAKPKAAARRAKPKARKAVPLSEDGMKLALADMPSVFAPSAFAERVGRDGRGVGPILNGMRRRGMIVKLDDGSWAKAETAELNAQVA